MSKYFNISVDTALGGNSPSDEVVASQKALKTYIDNNSGGGTVAIDGTTITKNSSDQIQATAVIDQNTGVAKTWTGTQAEYDAIVTKDPETEYIITDDIGDSATVIGAITEDVNELNAHRVIAFQAPTAANGYTWYRKYADGWVEQGGYCKDNTNAIVNITFPVSMSDTNYTVTGLMDILSDAGTYHYFQLTVYARNTTGISMIHRGGSGGSLHYFGWQVSGMAA